jgi:hypothetical protein
VEVGRRFEGLHLVSAVVRRLRHRRSNDDEGIEGIFLEELVGKVIAHLRERAIMILYTMLEKVRCGVNSH